MEQLKFDSKLKKEYSSVNGTDKFSSEHKKEESINENKNGNGTLKIG